MRSPRHFSLAGRTARTVVATSFAAALGVTMTAGPVAAATPPEFAFGRVLRVADPQVVRTTVAVIDPHAVNPKACSKDIGRFKVTMLWWLRDATEKDVHIDKVRIMWEAGNREAEVYAGNFENGKVEDWWPTYVERHAEDWKTIKINKTRKWFEGGKRDFLNYKVMVNLAGEDGDLYGLCVGEQYAYFELEVFD